MVRHYGDNSQYNNQYSTALSRVKDSDDSDVMTDVFATLFGSRCVVSDMVRCEGLQL